MNYKYNTELYTHQLLKSDDLNDIRQCEVISRHQDNIRNDRCNPIWEWRLLFPIMNFYSVKLIFMYIFFSWLMCIVWFHSNQQNTFNKQKHLQLMPSQLLNVSGWIFFSDMNSQPELLSCRVNKKQRFIYIRKYFVRYRTNFIVELTEAAAEVAREKKKFRSLIKIQLNRDWLSSWLLLQTRWNTQI